MTEILSFLTNVSWPGVVATCILTVSHFYRVRLMSRRASFRLGDLQIDAASTQELLSVLKECERLQERMA